MHDDYEPQRPNHFVNTSLVSDVNGQAVLPDLMAAGKASGHRVAVGE